MLHLAAGRNAVRMEPFQDQGHVAPELRRRYSPASAKDTVAIAPAGQKHLLHEKTGGYSEQYLLPARQPLGLLESLRIPRRDFQKQRYPSWQRGALSKPRQLRPPEHGQS